MKMTLIGSVHTAFCESGAYYQRNSVAVGK
jgi:hypothetical protein